MMDESHMLPAGPPSPSRELIRYAPEAREVVLRHGNSVITYNADSRQLSLEDYDSRPRTCPTCGRAYANHEDTYYEDEPPSVRPGYFRMLAQSRLPSADSSADSSPPTSPQLTLTRAETVASNVDVAETRLEHRGSMVATSRPHLPQRATVEDEPIETDVNDFASVLDNPSDLPTIWADPLEAEAIATDYGEPVSASNDQEKDFDDDISEEAAEKFLETFFHVERELGRGGKGTVLLVRNRVLGKSLGFYACKRIPVGDDKEWTENVLKELRPLENVVHKNLVTHFFAWSANYRHSMFVPKIPHLYILQQYCNNGTLFEYLRGSLIEEQSNLLRRRSQAQPHSNDRKLTLQEIGMFFRDIVAGLEHLHSRSLVHRDLKPQNVLLHADSGGIRALVSDFGETRTVDAPREATATGYTGTMAFAAPETVKRNSAGKYGNFTRKSDLFSLGMILYFMCLGDLPYTTCDGGESAADVEATRDEVSAWSGLDEKFIRNQRSDLPDELYAYLRLLLSTDPERRPSAKELLDKLDQDLQEYGRAKSPTNNTFRSSNGRRPSTLPPIDSGKYGADTRKRSPSLPQPQEQSSTAMVRSPSGNKYIAKQPDRSRSRSEAARLLPAPPYTISQRLEIALFRIESSNTLKIVIYALKVWSLLGGCGSRSLNLWTVYAMLALAGFDLYRLRPEAGRGRYMSTVLLLAFFGSLSILKHFNALCLAPEYIPEEYVS